MTTKEQKKDLILKKNYLRFLNKLHKEQLKLQLFDVNKMTEQQIKRIFSYYFVSKDDYYVLRNPNTILQIDNDIFKKMNEPKVRKPREKKPKKEIKFLDEEQPTEQPKEEEPLTQDITEEEEKIQPSFKPPETTFRSKYGVSKVQPSKEKIREEIKRSKEEIKNLTDKIKQLEEGSNQEDVITTFKKLVDEVMKVFDHLPEQKFKEEFRKKYDEIREKENKKRRDKQKSREETEKDLLEGEFKEKYNNMLKETKKLEKEKEKEKEKLFDFLKTLSNFEIEEIKTYLNTNFKSLYGYYRDLLKEFLEQKKEVKPVEEVETEKYEPPTKKKITKSSIVEEVKEEKPKTTEDQIKDLEDKKENLIQYMNDETTRAEQIAKDKKGVKTLTKQHRQTIIAGLNKSFFKEIIKTIDEIDLTLKELENKKEGSGKKYVKKIFKK
jgi:hypothetical protein